MHPKYLYVILFILSISCNSKHKTFKLNPVPGEIYNYSIIKTSSQEWTYQNVPHTIFDTIYLDIGLQGIKNNDDTIIYKLIFTNLKIIPRSFKITFMNSDIHNLDQYNPYATLDSICNSLRGLSVQVNITAEGNVTEVPGVDDLIANISNTSKLDINTVKRSLSDHVSVNAIKDLLNRMLSIPRDKEVKVADSWVKNIILITKAPVKFSNMYTLKKITGDSVYVEIKSMVSTAITTKGDNVYLKGKQDGEAILSVNTGMPYQYDVNLESITTTTNYDIAYKEYFTFKRTSFVPK